MGVGEKSGPTGATPSAASDLFSPVSLGRVSQVIVEQVRLLMHQGRLKPGDRLPSERDLCDRFGVSRVTVREALRVLEASGLVEIERAGR
jgi:DNA-binding FadR family transcriptional regulator